jgi:PAS domain S-box-containing protein
MNAWVNRGLAASWLRISIRAKGTALIAVPLATLLLALAWFGYLQREQERAEQWTLHTQQVQIKARELLTLLSDGQGAIRGYALTGREDFLGPYHDVEDRAPVVLTDLRRLVADNRLQTDRVNELAPLVRERMLIMDETRELVSAGQPLAFTGGASASAIAMLERSKAVMNECRVRLATLQAEEDRLLAERTEHLRRQSRLIWLVFMLSAGAAVAGGWLAAGLFASGITSRLQSLAANARRLANGEPLCPTMLGEDEINGLDREQHRAAKLILERETQLRASEERFRTLVTASTQMVWTTDANGEISGDLPMWRNITGQSRDDIRGLGWQSVLHPDDRERVAARWSAALHDRTVYDIEFRIREKHGAYRDVSVRGVPVLESDGSVREWVGTCSDVTESKRAAEDRQLNLELERRVRERTAQLESANQELEAFSYSVAHDLRSPLRHIDGFVRLLVDGYADRFDDTGRGYLDHVLHGTAHMGHLIDDLLNLARVGRQQIVPHIVGLARVVDEVRKDLQPETVGRDVEWKIGELPYTECDATLLRQVFYNLIANALKFTRPRAHTVIEIGHLDQQGESVLFVRDNGVGFNMKYAGKLFGVFQRLHRQEDFEGTGVGLVTVQRIIQKHGGRIWAEAEPDHGATFYFTLAEPAEVSIVPPEAQPALASVHA